MESKQQKKFKELYNNLLKLGDKNKLYISKILDITSIINNSYFRKQTLYNLSNKIKWKFTKGLKRFRYVIILATLITIGLSVYNTASDNISKLILEWTDRNFQISTQRKGNDTQEYNKVTKSNSVFTSFEKLEKSLKDNNITLDIFKLSYIPEGYELEDISVSYDIQVHITIRYINRSIQGNEQSFTYSIYSISNSNTDVNSKVIQEKTVEEVEIYKASNGIECYIFSNINWKVATFVKDYDIYSIYGLDDRNEIKKIVDGLYK